MNAQNNQSKVGRVISWMKSGLSESTAILSGQERTIQHQAVVGLVDIISSTEISNSVELQTEWELKRLFIQAAKRRATEFDMMVLNYTGDGFLFLANPGTTINWHSNLIRFYEALSTDFAEIIESMSSEIDPESTGLRFGVSRGSVMLGKFETNSNYWTAVGPDVNLAARLCARAGRNEIVISSRVQYALEGNLPGWSVRKTVYESVKGFEGQFPATHIAAPFEGSGGDVGFEMPELQAA